MKACEKNRMPIAWLVVGALDDTEAGALRAHLAECEGCRELLEKTKVLTKNIAAGQRDIGAQAPPGFHEWLRERLRETQPRPAWQEFLAGLGRAALTQRVAVPALAVLAVAAVLVIQNRPAATTVSATTSTVSAVAPQSGTTDPAPTAANYQIAASQSLSKLDEMLTKEGNEGLPPAPVYRASMRLPDNSF